MGWGSLGSMPRFQVTVMMALVLMATACSRGDKVEETTSAPTTTAAPVVTVPETVAGSSQPTTATQPPTTVVGIPDYSVMSRTQGDVLVVLIEPDSTYSDLDLRNVVEDVIDRFAPVTTLYVVDDEAAVALVEKADLTPEDQAILDAHYLLRLEDGFRIVFQGPFSDLEDVIVGS